MIYVGRLTYRQRDELKRFSRHAVGREAFRAHMILLSSRGYSVPQIAEIYNCDRDTVRAWIKRYLKSGIDGLRDAKKPGRPPKGGKAARWAISRAINIVPLVFGLRITNWTAKALRAILASFHMNLSIGTIRRILHSLGFRWRRPKLVALKSDPIKDFKVAVIDIFLKAFGPFCTVFFQDESYCQLIPNVRSCWMRRGQQKEIITPGTNKRVSVYGALNPRTGGWIHSIFLKKNAQNFIAFLETLCNQVKTGPILIILDNDRTHKAKVVREWLMEHPRVRLLWLPKYTPHLNPIETVWRHLKGHLANHCFKDIDELIWAIEQYFSHGSGVSFKLPIAA